MTGKGDGKTPEIEVKPEIGVQSASFSIESYNRNLSTWRRWVERFEITCAICKIVEDAERRLLILRFMGQTAYNTLSDRISPKKPLEVDYKDIVESLAQFFDPEPLELVENFRYHKRYQLENETIEEYLVVLRKLAKSCNFGNYLDTALRNQLVFGMKNTTAQKKCLERRNMTLKDVLEVALSHEMAEQGGKEIQKYASSAKPVEVVQRIGKPNANMKIPAKSASGSHCYRCGDANHFANTCKFKDVVCSACNKKGHLRRVCQSNHSNLNTNKNQNTGGSSAKLSNNNKNNNNNSNNNKIKNVNLENFEEIVSMHNIKGKFKSKMIVSLKCNGALLDFEADTGSPVSIAGIDIYNKYFADQRLNDSGIQLFSYCGKQLGLQGVIKILVQHGNCEKELELYISSGSKEPLMGRDWIIELGINLNDVLQNTLSSVHKLDVVSEIENLKQRYACVFNDSLGKVAEFEAKLHIKANAKPVAIKHRQVPFALKDRVENELRSLVESGVLVPVMHSNWATPIVVVPKANGAIRICGDYKVTLNPRLERDEYPLPTVEELFAEISHGLKYTKLDLKKAYLQLGVASECQEMLTITTTKGLFRPTRLMFGISSAPAIWQRFMEQILGGIKGVSVFLDDVKITGSSDREHIETLETVLKIFDRYNIRINLDKSVFFADSIEYCGYAVDKDGIHKIQSKIDSINDMPQPKTKDEVRSFVGLVNYYGRFFPNLASILYPLNNLLKNDVPFIWDSKCENSFACVKREMQSDRFLVHFDPKLPLILACDASPVGVGCVISHIMPDGTERPIQYASKTLSEVQQKYSQFDREAYAVFYGVRKFHQYLFGRKFKLLVDNKAISQILSPSKSLPLLSVTRMQHYAIFLQDYNYEIIFRKSENHGNVDALSRLPIEDDKGCIMDEVDYLQIAMIETMPVSVEKLGEETRKDSSVKELIQGLRSGAIVHDKDRFGIEQMEFSLLNNCLMRGMRAYIPKSLRENLLNELHDAHFGVVRMKNLARSYCWWPSIDHEIEMMAQNCVQCQLVRANPSKVPLHPWENAKSPFERVHADFAGPFHGKLFFVLMDAYSKWPEIYVIPDLTTDTTIKCCREIFSRFGIPENFVSDRGTQFTNSKFQDFLKMNGIKHQMGAPYHPSTNGLAERLVYTLKHKLKAINCHPDDYEKEIATMLLKYRKTVHPSTGKSPSMLMFNRQIRCRLDFMLPRIGNKASTSEIKGKVKSFEINDKVLARNYRDSNLKWVCGTIIQKMGKLHYMIKLNDGRIWKRHVDQLRKAGENSNENLQDNTDDDSTDSNTLQFSKSDNHTDENSDEEEVGEDSEYFDTNEGESGDNSFASDNSTGNVNPIPNLSPPGPIPIPTPLNPYQSPTVPLRRSVRTRIPKTCDCCKQIHV